MNVEFMQEYIALATSANFTAAAEQMFTIQSTLSRHIAKIESEVGATLFIRSTHSTILTEEGKRVLADFKKIIKIYDAMLEAVSSKHSKEIRLNALYYALERYISPLIQLYNSKYPETRVILDAGRPERILNSIIDYTSDMGLLMRANNRSVASNKSEKDMLEFLAIGTDHLSCMMCSNNPLADKKHLYLKDLKNETLVYMKNQDWLYDYEAAFFQKHGFAPNKLIYTDHVDTISSSVQETNGIAIVPGHLNGTVRENIVLVPFEKNALFIEMCLVWRKDNPNPNIKTFLDIAKSMHSKA